MRYCMFEYKRVSILDEAGSLEKTQQEFDLYLDKIIDEHLIDGWGLYEKYTRKVRPYKKLMDSVLRRTVKKVNYQIIVFYKNK